MELEITEWPIKKLGAVAEINPSKSEISGLPSDLSVSFVPMESVDAERGKIAEKKVRLLSQVRKGYKYFREGDVIFARITPCLENGKCAVAEHLENGIGFGSTEFLVVRPTSVILKEWVYHFLRQQSVRNQAKKYYTGTVGQQRVQKEFLENQIIPVPPISYQKAFLRIIEATLKTTLHEKQELFRIPYLVRRLRMAILSKAFQGELTANRPEDESAASLFERIQNERDEIKTKPRRIKDAENSNYDDLPDLPVRWIWITIGDVERFIGSGITPWGGRKVYVEEGIPFIRSQNVYPGGIQLEDIAHITPEIHEKMSRSKVQPNDVLLNITGASIGRSTFVPDDFGPANVNQHVCIIRTSRLVNHAFLSWFLNSPIGQSQIMGAQSGVTREGLNYGQLRKIAFPLAPFKEQLRIVKIIENSLANSYSLEKLGKNALDKIELLEQSVLKDAFSGRLTNPISPEDTELETKETTQTQLDDFQA